MPTRLPRLIATGVSHGEMQDTHFAHYGGWTIAAVRDSTDDTWMAQAAPHAYPTVEDYIAAARRGPDQILWASDFYTSKEGVRDDIVAMIDSTVQGTL